MKLYSLSMLLVERICREVARFEKLKLCKKMNKANCKLWLKIGKSFNNL